ncbi:MAG TPA: hypothetical protein VHR66_03535 [Gemmataceae bacterium]|jgi:hypothetical protein|nr:hypothetical protein [Gemmataceae bacterium]
MSPAGFVSDQVLSAFHQRFPVRQHMWAGCVKLWRVELAIRNPSPSLLSEWLGRATNPTAIGLPANVIALIRNESTIRRSFAVLELPASLTAIPVPSRPFDLWPKPIADVPPSVLRPTSVEVVPFASDWRTAPLVRVEAVPVVAVQLGDTVEVHLGNAEPSALATVAAEQLQRASQDEWVAAAREHLTAIGDVRFENGVLWTNNLNSSAEPAWLRAGKGQMREVGIVVLEQ